MPLKKVEPFTFSQQVRRQTWAQSVNHLGRRNHSTHFKWQIDWTHTQTHRHRHTQTQRHTQRHTDQHVINQSMLRPALELLRCTSQGLEVRRRSLSSTSRSCWVEFHQTATDHTNNTTLTAIRQYLTHCHHIKVKYWPSPWPWSMPHPQCTVPAFLQSCAQICIKYSQDTPPVNQTKPEGMVTDLVLKTLLHKMVKHCVSTKLLAV